MVPLDSLRARLTGDLITPDSPLYDSGRRLWNGMIDKRPAAIARCSGVADVVTCVEYAGEHDVPLAIRGGGHHVAGLAMCNDGLVIDLSRMRGAHVDPHARTIRAQAGMCWGDFDRETQVFGLATTGGAVSTTGIAGLTLGGGVGWLNGRCGFVCDNVLAFEVVTADGRVRTASAREEPDLYWALRGGGGNFGVVTSFEYQLYPINTVLAGLLVHPLERGREVLQFYRDYVTSAPDELTIYAAALTTPDGFEALALVPCYCGDNLENGARILEPLRRFGPPVADLVAPMPYISVQRLLDDACPYGIHSYWKMNTMPAITDDAIETFVSYARIRTSARSIALFEHYHGQALRVAPDATAFRLRSDQFSIVILALWDGGAADAHIEWTRNFWNAMSPSSGGGVYVNALNADEESRLRDAYGLNYGRLSEIKTRYDPSNLFRVNHNIRPLMGAV
jgi:FAD binding domain/Berberine and berberine like